MQASRSAQRILSPIRSQPAASVLGNSMTNSSPPYLAARSVLRCASAAKTRADGAQALVSGRVPVLVVVFLEMVDIDHQKRQARTLAIGSAPFLQQALVKAAAIGEARETVLGGEGRESSFERLLFRHVARDRDNAVDRTTDLPADPQGRFDPDFGFLPMACAVGDARILRLAVL